jgi:AraC-like DNA-binding protein
MLDSRKHAAFGGAPQRLAALVGLPELAGEMGVPLAEVLAGLPLDPTIFESDENRIPYGLAVQLLENATRLTKCPHFGLLLGARHDHRCMGAAGRWMQNAPTLEAALTGFIALQSTATRGATSYLHKHADHIIFGYGAYDRTALGYTQNYAVVIPMAHNIVRRLTGGKVTPVEVLFSFRKPADARPYRDFFGVPVHFDQPQSGLVLTHASLHAPVLGASPLDFDLLQSQAAAFMPQSGKAWSDKVRRCLRTSLLRGEATAPHVAARIGLHAKTLSRHLAAEGTGFKQLSAEVRCGAAQELLAVTDLALGDIALALGYANQPAFNDAFKRWSGVTPGSWRETWHADGNTQHSGSYITRPIEKPVAR